MRNDSVGTWRLRVRMMLGVAFLVAGVMLQLLESFRFLHAGK
ncbi:hypothetical protein [Caballeronia glebae]|jgi:hypothetical protein|uniref:Uncharacterized protein n=1 Tax=Caballeronia glebae TaxID=1777143 RepID=A0A158AMU2_9BURK|nr:hypothetical protein AWB82_02626 [Caballeronia glebae]